MAVHKTRPAPDCTAARAALEQGRADRTAAQVLRYSCTLVTPMYGGGVRAGEVDTAMPIRATAIRGQLRHWWRLLNRKDSNGKLRASKELFEAERVIWGGLGDAKTLAKSKVVVGVEARPAKKLMPVGRMHKNNTGKDSFSYDKALNNVAYVLYPAAPNDKKPAIGEILPEEFGFTLTLRGGTGAQAPTDEQWEQVKQAVRWWASFGGVGARTRRGCGAVEVRDGDTWLAVAADEVAAHGWKIALADASDSAYEAWQKAAGALRDFRQKPIVARNPGVERNPGQKPRPGRSRWPEPDAIRRITNQASSRHSTPVCYIGNVFPRAAFGLPIITHFKDYGKKNPEPWDPPDTTLKPIPDGKDVVAERMASPLILRPYHDGTGWRPAVLCLDTDHIDRMGLSLEGKFRASPTVIAPGMWQAGNKVDVIKPMAGHGKDVIEAFLAGFAQLANEASAVQSTSTSQSRIKTFERPNVSKRGATIKVEPQGQTPHKITGADAQKLYGHLSDYAKQQLDSGKLFNRLDITFDGSAYVSLKEHQA